ncbi:MAG: hypothetical protein O7B99_12350 [Planctomycetota bacterium]|nr:hypothetical protein [Planctomycetota bacterium]
MLTRILLALTARLPEPAVGVFVGGVARVLRRALRTRSDVSRAFLRQALGPGPEAELEQRVLQSWRHFLRVMIDSERLARLPSERLLEHFDVRWTEEARALRDSGEGCVLLTAHVGNWEASSTIAPWLGFDPLYAVVKPIRSRPFSKLVQRSRERRGIRLLPRRGAMRSAFAVIEAGGAIGMLLDQRARVRPVLAPFFGRLARCDRSAGVMLRRIKATVLISACYLTERPLHYRLEFFDCIRPDEVQHASPEEIAARINAAYERMILRHPDQYFWLHDRYRDTPERLPEMEAAAAPGRVSPGNPPLVE